MPKKEYPSVEYVRQCLRYEDGKLFWLQRPREHFADYMAWATWNAKYANQEAGCAFRDGGDQPRWHVCVAYRLISRYHIVWALHHDEWRPRIDHKNRNPSDDRIENLRPATQSQNLQNSSRMSNNTSGYKGVSWHRRLGRWRARIRIDGHEVHLGCFDSPADAHRAYKEAAAQHYGEFAHDGT